jgi:hypothetical protein
LSSEFYQPLIERNLDAIPVAARAYAKEHSVDELYLAVARFAVLAFAPSMHGKRAVMACRAAHLVRDPCGEQWIDLVIECANYAAENRPPWSEPPIFESSEEFPSREELERNAGDETFLILDAAFALIPILGEKGTAALLRMPQLALESPDQKRSPDAPLETTIDEVIASRGSIESVQRFLVANKGAAPAPVRPPIYHLARDFGDALLAHAHAPFHRRDEFLAAVKHNLEHGEDFSEWSLA